MLHLTAGAMVSVIEPSEEWKDSRSEMCLGSLAQNSVESMRELQEVVVAQPQQQQQEYPIVRLSPIKLEEQQQQQHQQQHQQQSRQSQPLQTLKSWECEHAPSRLRIPRPVSCEQLNTFDIDSPELGHNPTDQGNGLSSMSKKGSRFSITRKLQSLKSFSRADSLDRSGSIKDKSPRGKRFKQAVKTLMQARQLYDASMSEARLKKVRNAVT